MVITLVFPSVCSLPTQKPAAKSKNAAANAIKIRFVFLNFIVYFLCNSVDIIMFFAIIKMTTASCAESAAMQELG